MQRYEKYKDSGVDWIGEIPVEWNILKLKFLFKDVSIKNRPDLDLLSVTQDQGVVPRSMVENRMVMPTGNLESFKVISKGDFAISLRSFEGGLEYSEYEGLISPAYTVLKSQKEINDNYFKFLFKSKAFIAELQLSIVGIREGKNISYEELKYSYTPIPPLTEQQTIANFLDGKTAKIDQTITIKQKEIELLKERRQILIQKAVTKGLDDTVKLKDSGVDWIGEIPEHWEVRKLKYCLNSKLKYGANESGVEYDLDLPRYIRITDFGFDGKLSEDKKLSLTWLQGKDYLLKDGDILFARSGATVGKSYQFKTSMSFEKHYSFAGYLIKAEANEEIILSDYLYLYTNSNLFDNWKSAIFNKATIENIGADKYSTLSVVVPPVIEQKEILLEYNTKNEKIAKAISIKEQEIEKLKEYKMVLIDQVVTGKVRVS